MRKPRWAPSSSVSCANVSSTPTTWRMKSTSSYKSLRTKATGLSFTLSASTETLQQFAINTDRDHKQSHRSIWTHMHHTPQSSMTQCIQVVCLHSHTHTDTHINSFGSGPNKWLLLDILLIMGFPLSKGWTRCSSSAFYSSRSRSGQGHSLQKSQVQSNHSVCLLRESHNTHRTDSTAPPVTFIFVWHRMIFLSQIYG